MGPGRQRVVDIDSDRQLKARKQLQLLRLGRDAAPLLDITVSYEFTRDTRLAVAFILSIDRVRPANLGRRRGLVSVAPGSLNITISTGCFLYYRGWYQSVRAEARGPIILELTIISPPVLRNRR